MRTNIIIVEGLPGSGKSTTAKLISDILNKYKINNKVFSEGNYNHPVDFDGVAYFEQNEFEKLKMNFKNEASILGENSIQYYNGYIIEYRKLIEENKVKFREKILDEIHKNDIYELPLELNHNLIKKKWKAFAENHVDDDIVLIMECCFIQNPVTVSFVRSNAAKADVVKYVLDLEETILPFRPLLVYVEQRDLESTLKKAVRERPREWSEGFINYYTVQGYGLSMQLIGLNGVLEVLKERKNIENEIYNLLKIEKIRIDNSQYNFEYYKNSIEKEIVKYLL